MPTTRKKTARKTAPKTAAKTAMKTAAVPTALPARHYHPTHPGEFDIDLDWPCEDTSRHLIALKEALRLVIASIKHCQEHHKHAPVEGTDFVAGNYHNITVCGGQH